MKIEEKIQKMKQVYQGISVSDEVVVKEWQLLESALGEQQKTYYSPLLYRAFTFVVIFLLLTGGIVSLAQASKEGEFLYPVKEFSQDVVKKIKKNAPILTNEIITPTTTLTPTPTVTVKQKKIKIIRPNEDEDEFEREDEREDEDVRGVSDQKIIQRGDDMRLEDKEKDRKESSNDADDEGEKSDNNSSKNK